MTTSDGFTLAGGAWSTVVGRPERFLAIKPWGRGSDNLGLRPIGEP